MAKNKIYSLDKAVGEGPTLEINGKKYRTAPLKMKHLGELKAKIRSEMMKAASLASADTNPYMRNDLIAKVARNPIGMDIISEEMTSPEILQWLIWRSIVELNPEFKIEELDDMPLTGLDELASAMGGVFEGMNEVDKEVNGQSAESKSPPPPPTGGSG